tara:strand:+ start:552 stop:1016 length:465 start_codon:yes stop_codon:yes gene_type:complete
MIVRIDISESEFCVNIYTDKGSKYSDKFENIGNAWVQISSDSNIEKNDELLEETVEAIEEVKFPIMDICNALKNQIEEPVVDNESELMTEDGHKLEKGDTFFTIASNAGEFVPFGLKYPKDWGCHGSSIFKDRSKCLEECDEMNKRRELRKKIK